MARPNSLAGHVDSHVLPAWLWICRILLIITLTAKLVGIATDAPVLIQMDSLTGLSNKTIVLLAAYVESALLMMSLFPTLRWHFVYALNSFGLVILAYRLWSFDTRPSCPCLGGIFHWSESFTKYEDRLLTSLAAWFLISGMACLFKPHQQ